MMETTMADVPVEVKKAPAPEATVPDVWRSFRSEMDRLFDGFASGFGFPSLHRVFDIEPAWRSMGSFGFSAPLIDMSEDDKAYKISAELPGLDANDVDVSISGNTLVLKGEKRQEKEEKEKNYYFSERAYGTLQRTFELPPSIDRDKVSADFSKGVLTITLPKTPEAQKQLKKIEGQSRLIVMTEAADTSRRLDPFAAWGWGEGPDGYADAEIRRISDEQESHWSLQLLTEA
jgi:HSP20 family protein